MSNAETPGTRDSLIEVPVLEKNPVNYEACLPIAHARHYSWGDFYLSQEFCTETGIMPLVPATEDYVQKRSEYIKLGEPLIRVIMVTPEEVEALGEKLEGGLDFEVRPRFYKKQIDIVVVSCGSMHTARTSILETLAESLDGAEHTEDELENVTGPYGEPVKEYIDQQAGELYLEGLLTQVLAPEAQEAFRDWLSLEFDKKSLRRMLNLGISGFFSGGIYAYLAQEVAPNNFKAQIPAFLAVALLMAKGMHYNFKDIQNERAVIKRVADDASLKFSRKIATDIYWDFSREGFERHIQKTDPSLGGSDSSE